MTSTISSKVVFSPKQNLIDEFDSVTSRPIAVRTCDGFMIFELHADPFETAILLRRESIIWSACIPMKQRLLTWGNRWE